LIGDRIAAPVLEHAGRGRVGGVVGGVAYLELEDGFVLAVTAPGVPPMPNGIGLAARPARWPSPGAAVELGPGRLVANGFEVRWPPGAAPVWDPVPVVTARPPLSGDPRVAPFAAALAARDAEGARVAAAPLIGRGGGLTPEGDDLLAGALAVSAALAGELAGVLPLDLRTRTTLLSATLLELAARGAVMEPVHGLLGPRWEAALGRLRRVGHSTGRAYAAGAGAVLSRAA
jgi:Protein of unknown function (DUF2877)